MPQAAIAVATVLAGGMGPVTALQLAVGKFVVGVASSLALSFVSGVLAPKPDVPDLSSFGSIKSSGVTQQFNQPVVARRIVYGEVRTSGPVVYAGVTESNKYLHLVIPLAAHEVEEIGEILIDDVSIVPEFQSKFREFLLLRIFYHRF